MGQFDWIILSTIQLYIYIRYTHSHVSTRQILIIPILLEVGYFKKYRFNPLAGLGLLSWNPQDNIQAIRALGGSGQYSDHTEFEGTELLSFVPGRCLSFAKSFGVQKGHFFFLECGVVNKKAHNFSDFDFLIYHFKRLRYWICLLFVWVKKNATIFTFLGIWSLQV